MIYTAAYLTGVAASTLQVPATWAAISDGSFRITLNGTGYNVDAIDFTGLTTMAQIAAKLQSKLRTATSGLDTVVWSTDHFVITSGNTTYNSAISVTTTSTGTVGTDISGVGKMGTSAGTITLVSSDLGYSVLDLYNATKLALFQSTSDTSLDPDTFRFYLNDAYRECISRLLKVFPNYYMSKTAPFTIYQVTDRYALPTDCLTVTRVSYPDPDSTDLYPQEIVIPETNLDERDIRYDVRWYRDVTDIVFRSMEDFDDDIDNAIITYRKRVPDLIADTDRPMFPNNDWDTIMIPYIQYRYYKDQKMEVDSKDDYNEFERRINKAIKDIRPTKSPFKLNIKVDNGIDPSSSEITSYYGTKK